MNIYFYICLFMITLQNTLRFWAYSSCFKLKIKSWAAYAIYLSVSAGITFFHLYYQAINNKMFPLVFLLVIFFYWLPFHLLTEGSTIKKLILNIIDQIVIDTAIEFFLYFIASLMDYAPIPSLFDYNRVVCSVAFLLLAVPIKYIMVKIWNKVNNAESERLNPIFLIFPVSQIIAFIMLHLERYYSEELWELDLLLITSIYLTVLTASSVIYIIFISDVEKKNKLEKEYNALNYTRKLEEAHYAAIEEKQAETAKIRHDFKNQLIALQGLINAGNSEEAKTLFGEMETSINAAKEKEYCSVPVINALLTEKEKTAEEAGVSLKCNITLYDTGRISQIHLCSIFSNLIDNALKECARLEGEREVEINAAQKNGFISVRCENPVKEGKDRVLKPSDSKGYGMKILQDIALKYDGRYKCEIKDGRCVSVITVGALGE